MHCEDCSDPMAIADDVKGSSSSWRGVAASEEGPSCEGEEARRRSCH